MALHVFLLAVIVAAVAGDESDTPQWLDNASVELPKPPPYPETPENKTTYFAGLSSTVWILLSIKLIFIVMALVSLFIWCKHKNKKTKYAVHI